MIETVVNNDLMISLLSNWVGTNIVVFLLSYTLHTLKDVLFALNPVQKNSNIA